MMNRKPPDSIFEPDKWDRRFLKLAEYVAGWSKDPSTKVGAVIADDFHRIISLGYNGFPRGVTDSEGDLNDRDMKYHMMVHAEFNAILFARQSLVGTTLYTWPLPPCSRCAAVIIQSGIRSVCSPPLDPKDPLYLRWSSNIPLARRMLDEAGTKVFTIPREGGE